MLIERLQQRGWPVIPMAGQGRFGVPLRAGDLGFVVLDIEVDPISASPIASVLQARLKPTQFVAWQRSNRVSLLYRVATPPRQNQTWQLKQGGEIKVRWGGEPVLIHVENALDPRFSIHPVAFRPDDLPLVDDDALREALDSASHVAPFDTKPDVPAVPTIDHATRRHGLSPKALLGAPWVISSEGLVVKGRPAWLRAIVCHWLVTSIDIVDAQLGQSVAENFCRTTAGGEAALFETLQGRPISALIEETKLELFRGSNRPIAAPKLARAQIEVCASEPEWLDDIAPSDARSEIAYYPLPPGPPIPDLAGMDRLTGAARSALRDVVADAIEGFLSDVEQSNQRIRILNVLPGLGKTTQVIAALLQRRDHLRPILPVALLMPNYENLAEARAKIEASGLDIVWLPIMDPHERDALNDPSKIKIMTFGGRIHAGCRIPEHMELAMKVGQGASLCHSVDQDGVDLFCPHYSTCPAIAQRQQAQHAEIILMPHQFLVVSPPAELDGIKGVVVDERTDQLFLRTEIIPVDEISVPRKTVRVPKDMAAQGISMDALAEARLTAWAEVLRSMRAGLDPAGVVAQSVDLTRAVEMAGEYCKLARRRDIRVTPDTPIHILQQASEQTNVLWLDEEIVLWEVLLDDVHSGRHHSVRIQFADRDGIETIRLSWRCKPNWADRPVLMLDGSASPHIVRKVWGSGEDDGLIEHRSAKDEIVLNAALPTVFVQGESFSKTTIIPSNKLDDQAVIDAAQSVDRLRSIITSIAGRNADGRVLVGAMKKVIEAIKSGWCPPVNVDFAHYGALRGLNAYEGHKIAISIGRFEIPPEIIQGAAAALSYDDPPDLAATAPGGHSVTLLMRDRRRIAVPSQTTAGMWERALQIAYREEEMRQFAGRLRAVQRIGRFDEGMCWVIIGNVVPEETVVDAIVSSDDLVADRFLPLLECARRSGGILIEGNLLHDGSRPDASVTLKSLFEEFLRQPLTRKAWRMVERVVRGRNQRVLVPRHMKPSDFGKSFPLWADAPTWLDLVSNACLGEVFEAEMWGDVALELQHVSSSYARLGLSPEHEGSCATPHGLSQELPWPGVDGLILPAGVVLAGLSLVDRHF
jgi:hypothetical protein